MKVTLYRFAYLGILVTSFDILLQKVYANQCIYRLDFFHNHTPYSLLLKNNFLFKFIYKDTLNEEFFIFNIRVNLKKNIKYG